jgi:uncharacterized protein (TIGR02996 family)
MDDALLKRTEVEGFLRTIREDPRDNTNRLVFADWLDEHGEPDLALEYRRSYAELRDVIVGLCNKYDESDGRVRRGYGYKDPDMLIQAAVACAAGTSNSIYFGAAEDLCYAMRSQGEDYELFWRTIELLSGYKFLKRDSVSLESDYSEDDVRYHCDC